MVPGTPSQTGCSWLLVQALPHPRGGVYCWSKSPLIDGVGVVVVQDVLEHCVRQGIVE